MIKRNFPKLTEKVSLLGFGGMRFPVSGGKIDYAATEKMIARAYGNGVNYYDTAYFYHGGESETVMGSILKAFKRNSFYFADKMPGWLVQDVDGAERIFNEQLKRCKVDYFDFYLAHSLSAPNFEIYKKFLLEFLIKKKEKGLIRRLGFSFHDCTAALKPILDYYPWDIVQLQINYLDWTRQNAKGQYEAVTALGIPVVVMEPVRGGSLAVLEGTAADILKKAGPKKSIASWAIRYAMSLPGVLTVLSGMSDIEQVADNLKTVKDFKPLTKAEYAAVNETVKEYLKKDIIPCTSCRYCMDCPEGIDIPWQFSLYNDFLIGNDRGLYDLRMRETSSAPASSCAACNKCAEACPQKINIPERLKGLG